MAIIRSSLFIAGLIAASMPAWSATAPVAQAWPQFRGPARDGVSPEKLAFGADAPKQLWKASLGTGFTSIAVAGGLVYSSGNAGDQDSVQCFDAASGKPLWKYSYPAKLDPKMYEGGPNATPTVVGGSVFIFNDHFHS